MASSSNSITEAGYCADSDPSDVGSQETCNGSASAELIQVIQAPSTVLKRPSFFNLQGDTGLHPSTQIFDLRVIKKLDSEFDDTDADLEEEKLKTFLRIRPSSFASKIGKLPARKVLEIKDDTTVIAYPLQKSLLGPNLTKQTEFKFTKILGANSGQSAVFDVCVIPIIEKFLKHENCLIFSYGATNSGKTYTLQGHGHEYGIIPRTLEAIFNRLQGRIFKQGDIKPHLYQSFYHLKETEIKALQEKKEKILSDAALIKKELGCIKRNLSGCSSQSQSSSQSGSSVNLVGAGEFDQVHYALFANSTMFSVWVSYAELYNERVYDLLNNVYTGKNRRRKELRLLQDKNGYVYIRDLTEIHVTSDDEAYKIFQAGRKNLQFAATQMNQTSSRSHSFFTLRVVSIGIGNGLMPFPKSVHRLTFCDLAGTERVHQTENEGCRLKESGNINQSLVVLLKVIRILREKQNNGNNVLETIPFRESKLTHLFKSFFTSSTHICMLVNVNPDPSMAESTMQVLHNSAIASNVIVFRPVDQSDGERIRANRKVRFAPEEKQLSNVKSVRKKVQEPDYCPSKAFDSSSSADEAEKYANRENSSESNDDEKIQTVIGATKAFRQKVAALEKENSELKKKLVKSKLEKEQQREEFLKLLAEQNQLWHKRLEETQIKEENFANRRLSLMRLKYKLNLSPGNRCGRHNPPVVEMENIYESDEHEEIDSETNYANNQRL